MRQEERRARTTNALLDAAVTVFARQGVRTATVDDVAHAAGYTKGAVYANFGNKDALVLAVLDRHLDDQRAQVNKLAATTSDGLRDALQGSSSEAMADQDFGILLLELWLYAARNPEAKAALAERYQRMREALAEASERWRDSAASAPTASADAATLALALDVGLFLMHLLHPDAVTPDLRATALAEVLGPRSGVASDDGQVSFVATNSSQVVL